MSADSSYFTDLSVARSEASNNRLINVAGWIVDHRLPMATKKECMCTFNICDRSSSLIETSLMVRLFHPNKDALPSLEMETEKIYIIVLDDLKMSRYNGSIVGLSNRNRTKWTIYTITPQRPKKGRVASPNVEVHSSSHGTTMASVVVQTKCTDLYGCILGKGGIASAYGVNPNTHRDEIVPAQKKKRKLSQIKDIKQDCYYDLKGLVVKIYPDGSRFTVYITDFTENEMLYDYDSFGNSRNRNETEEYAYNGGGVFHKSDGNARRWKAPPGKYTLQIVLWDATGAYASKHVKEGDLVLVENVRAKISENGMLEGAVHGDRNFPHKVFIKVCKDNETGFEDVKAGKRKFEQEETKLRKYEEDEKRRRKEAEEKVKLEQELARKNRVNPNVHTGYAGVICISIGDIMTLPHRGSSQYINQNYRICGRVIDFSPAMLEDFCVKLPTSNTHFDISQTPAADLCEDAMVIDNDSWVWNFNIRVQGLDGNIMDVRVSENEGEKLLGGMKACNLRADGDQLNMLRERLFLLWGDLEERKQGQRAKLEEFRRKCHRNSRNNNVAELEQIFKAMDKEIHTLDVKADESSRPFECLVKEAGADNLSTGQRERVFFITMTTIKYNKPGNDGAVHKK